MTAYEQQILAAARALVECDGLLATDRQTSEAWEALKRLVHAAQRDTGQQVLL